MYVGATVSRGRRLFGCVAAGAYRGVRAWWSREHWRSELASDLAGERAAAVRAAVGTRGPISVRAAFAVAVFIASRADGRTGRNAVPGEDEIVAATGYSETTVEKAVAVLVELGWLRVIRTGKNWLTYDERLELHRAGTKARARRPVYACTYPVGHRRAAPSAAAVAQPASAVDNSEARHIDTTRTCALPTTRSVSGFGSIPAKNTFRPEQASRTDATRRPSTKDGTERPNSRPARRVYRANPATVRLAKDLRARVPWLRHVEHQRIMPPLHRYAQAGWSARDIQTHLDRLPTSRGWTVPTSPHVTDNGTTDHGTAAATAAARRSAMRSPWGYLAYLLRQLDPTDLAADRAYLDEQRTAEDYQHLLIYGPECPHGQPGGNVPSPTKGILYCPMCRHERAGVVT